MRDLGFLPSISFAPLDPEENQRTIFRLYEGKTGKTLHPGDPERLFLEAVALDITTLCTLIDMAGKQNYLAFAEKGHLDHLGAIVGEERLEMNHSRCRLRFELAEALDFAVSIPQYTRVGTQDRRITFRTDTLAVINPGETAVIVPATAIDAGTDANGLVPGQVNLLVDPLPYVVRARNINLTMGGAPVEGDLRFRERIQLAPETFTCAGPVGMYRALALRVNPDIAEVTVWTPGRGVVDVRLIMSGGELPDEVILEAVRAALSAEDVRPLTDTVVVAAPVPVEYALSGGWYLRKSDSALAASITNAVNEALEEFRLWQRSAPGRDINPSRLISLVESAGAKRIVLPSPEFTMLECWQIARESSVNFVFMGVEDD